MAHLDTLFDTYTLEEQVRSLDDDELLDFWEESQYLEELISEGEVLLGAGGQLEYERVILRELQRRTCLKRLCRS